MTERSRRNIFKIREKLEKGFEKREAENDDEVEMFRKENKKQNFFNFQEYFFLNYQQQNKGLSTKLSKIAQKSQDEFEQKIGQMIYELKPKRRKKKTNVEGV